MIKCQKSTLMGACKGKNPYQLYICHKELYEGAITRVRQEWRYERASHNREFMPMIFLESILVTYLWMN